MVCTYYVCIAGMQFLQCKMLLFCNCILLAIKSANLRWYHWPYSKLVFFMANASSSLLVRLKVLSSKMDPVKLGSFDISLLKEASRRLFRKFRPSHTEWDPFKEWERLLFFNCELCHQLRQLRRIFIASTFGHWKEKILRHFFNTIAQFTNSRSIHSGFYQWEMIDDNKKKFIPHLAIANDFFHSAFVNPCMK